MAFHQLSAATLASGSDWALGVLARCRALVSDGNEAEVLYLEAIERLGRTSVGVELARAHLLYGEWLRRVGRRVDARRELRVAYAAFSSMCVEPFAERARRELLATGEIVRKRSVETFDELTPQEDAISRLASSGCTNSEIAIDVIHKRTHRRVAPPKSVHEARDTLEAAATGNLDRSRTGSLASVSASGLVRNGQYHASLGPR